MGNSAMPTLPHGETPAFLRTCPTWCTSTHKYDLHSHTVGVHRPDPNGYTSILVRVIQYYDDRAPVVQVTTDTETGLGISACGQFAPDEATALAFAFEACGNAEVAELLRTAVGIAQGEKAEVTR